MSFNELGLQETLLQAVNDSGYTSPTPIQSRAIPAILTGKDVMAAAQTGTGKTAGFTLPLLQRLSGKPPVGSNQVRALILTPTRELAAQIQESIETYGKHEKLRSVVIFGGVNINPQQMALRKGCDILVATPGRLLDLHQQNAVKFNAIEVLVLDEADRMLDMGFIRDIRKILALLPKQRQNLMFSATFSDEIRELARTICHEPVEIDVAPRNSTVDAITQRLYHANKDMKLPLLAKLLLDTPEQVLVFNRTKHGANNLVKKLAQYGVNGAAIHGNKSQAQRTKALADFKSGKIQVLVATDIAARGLDIEQLAMVVNYELPQVPEDYVHRIGRTGRAGATGLAISLVADDENGQLRAIERLIKRRIEKLEFDRATLPERKAGSVEIADDDRERQPRNNGRQGQRNGQHGARRGGQRNEQRNEQAAAPNQNNPRRGERPQQRSAQAQGGGQARQQGEGRQRNGQGSGQAQRGGQNGQARNGQPRNGQGRNGLSRNGQPNNGQARNGQGRNGPQQRRDRPRQDQRNGNNPPPRITGDDDNRGNTAAYATHNAPAANSFWRKLRESIPGLGS
ncbi:MAG TPA: DEAD/DEAH box helicase [Pseudomonadales bacterium]